MLKRSSAVKGCFLSLTTLVLLGTSCPVPSIGVVCTQDLDASEFGFTLTAPAGYECYNVFPNSALLMSVRYRQESTGNVCSIIVGPAGDTTPTDEEGITIEELADRTNTNGVTFERVKAQVEALNVTSYIGTHTLSSGNVLSITLVGFSDDPALLDALNAVIDSTVLVGG